LKPAAVLKPVADSKPPALLKRQQNLLSFFTVPAKKAATKSTAKKAHANFTIDSDSDVEVVDVVPARKSSSRTAVKPKTYVLDDSDDSDVKVVDVVPARKRSAGTAGSDDDSDFEFY
jgi:peroxiredoxin